MMDSIAGENPDNRLPRTLALVGILLLAFLLIYEVAGIVNKAFLGGQPEKDYRGDKAGSIKERPSSSYNPTALFGKSAGFSADPEPVESDLNLELHGILTNSRQKFALIGQGAAKPDIFTLNDEIISGVKLTHIDQNHVVLRHNGKRKLLPMLIKESLSAQDSSPGSDNFDRNAASTTSIPAATTQKTLEVETMGGPSEQEFDPSEQEFDEIPGLSPDTRENDNSTADSKVSNFSATHVSVSASPPGSSSELTADAFPEPTSDTDDSSATESASNPDSESDSEPDSDSKNDSLTENDITGCFDANGAFIPYLPESELVPGQSIVDGCYDSQGNYLVPQLYQGEGVYHAIIEK